MTSESKSSLHLKLVKCRSIGVVPRVEDSPVLFFDIDTVNVKIRSLLLEYANLDNTPNNINHKHWAIYQTHHGYHLVMKTYSWDETRTHLIALRGLTDSDYLSLDDSQFIQMVKDIPRTMRIRIERKWLLDGKQTCSAPYKIASCFCYTDLRKGIKEIYDTFD